MNTKHIQARFLKCGLLHLDVPADSTIEQMQVLGKQFIDDCWDSDLIHAMEDVEACEMSPSRFDADSFTVECIESADYDVLYSTPLWDEYAGYNL